MREIQIDQLDFSSRKQIHLKSKLQDRILHSVPQGHVVPSKTSNFAIIKTEPFCPMEFFLKIGIKWSNILTFFKVFILTLLTMNFRKIYTHLEPCPLLSSKQTLLASKISLEIVIKFIVKTLP